MLQLKTKGQAVALDNSKAMLAYAGKVASDVGAAVQFQHGDMQTFKLQVTAMHCGDCQYQPVPAVQSSIKTQQG